MKKFYVAVLLFSLVLLTQSAIGQTVVSTPAPAPAPTPASVALFSAGTQALNLHLGKQNNAGTDIFAQFLLTKHILLRTDSVLAPGNNFQGYYAGAGAVGSLDKIFAKTNLPKSTFQVYGFLEGGVVRNVPANGIAVQKPSFFAHGGINYDPTKSGKFSINLIDGGFLTASGAGFGTNNGYAISVGLKLGLWTTK